MKNKKQYEIAELITTRTRHIIVERKDFPWQKGIAVTLCETVGQFSKSKYIYEHKLAIRCCDFKVCVGCMDIIRSKEIKKYQIKPEVQKNVISIIKLLKKTKIPEYYGKRRGEKNER